MHEVVALLALLLAVPEPDIDVADLSLFPCSMTVKANVAANRHFQDWCKLQVSINPARGDEYGEALAKADRLRDMWWYLQRAQESEDEDARRHYLRRLRDGIGPWAYYRGLMPGPCP